jgi:hypothetical protein
MDIMEQRQWLEQAAFMSRGIGDPVCAMFFRSFVADCYIHFMQAIDPKADCTPFLWSLYSDGMKHCSDNERVDGFEKWRQMRVPMSWVLEHMFLDTASATLHKAISKLYVECDFNAYLLLPILQNLPSDYQASPRVLSAFLQLLDVSDFFGGSNEEVIKRYILTLDKTSCVRFKHYNSALYLCQEYMAIFIFLAHRNY